MNGQLGATGRVLAAEHHRLSSLTHWGKRLGASDTDESEKAIDKIAMAHALAASGLHATKNQWA